MNHTLKTKAASLPVFKIDYHGSIIEANNSALDFFNEAGFARRKELPKSFLRSHPEIFSHPAEFDFAMNTGRHKLYFSVISFEEAGYIGFYSFKEEKSAA